MTDEFRETSSYKSIHDVAIGDRVRLAEDVVNRTERNPYRSGLIPAGTEGVVQGGLTNYTDAGLVPVMTDDGSILATWEALIVVETLRPD